MVLASGGDIGRVEGHWHGDGTGAQLWYWCRGAVLTESKGIGVRRHNGHWVGLGRRGMGGCVLGRAQIFRGWDGAAHCMGGLGSCWFILREGVWSVDRGWSLSRTSVLGLNGFLRGLGGLGVHLACDRVGSDHLVCVCREVWRGCRVVQLLGLFFFGDCLWPLAGCVGDNCSLSATPSIIHFNGQLAEKIMILIGQVPSGGDDS